MKIKCKECGHTETINKMFFCKVLGVSLQGLTLVTAVTALVTATALSWPICLAIFLGGGLMVHSDKILGWACKNFPCPRCGAKSWKEE